MATYQVICWENDLYLHFVCFCLYIADGTLCCFHSINILTIYFLNFSQLTYWQFLLSSVGLPNGLCIIFFPFFCKFCRPMQRKTHIFVVCFHLLGPCDYFASHFSYSVRNPGFAMEHCRCLVDKAIWTYEVGLISFYSYFRIDECLSTGVFPYF